MRRQGSNQHTTRKVRERMIKVWNENRGEVSQRELAKRFGISEARFNAIVSGK